ncbi:MAG: helix-turn-helix transcriptional regulator [Phaeodactylibacter sp.]|nr:helix-turn-helix transcriptional regulator [Bacteroidota bacterium]MCB0585280.1 helix-turn-helix transcriptional regulator [Phaeodactylibacter sp.]MCB9265614.1 helix-turn-helix transcriptional regulator [Lewinellaceae bacterium]
MATRKYNKLKQTLKQKKRTGKWLASELGVDETTVSRWCQNLTQPSVQTLFDIAELLDVEPGELLVQRKDRDS